jgi:hypothetical protein
MMTSEVSRAGNGLISWSVHPAGKHPVKTAVALAGIGIIVGGIYGVSHDMTLSAIGFLVFLVCLAPFFQRTDYEMDDEGVTRRCLGIKRTLRWTEIRRYNISRRGVYLSPHRTETWWDFRGIYMMFNENREMVIAGIQSAMAKTGKKDIQGICR